MISQNSCGSAPNIDKRLSDIFRTLDKRGHRGVSQIYFLAVLAFLKTEADEGNPSIGLDADPGFDEKLLKRFTAWYERQSQIVPELSEISEHFNEFHHAYDPSAFGQFARRISDLLHQPGTDEKGSSEHIEHIIVKSLHEKDREVPESLVELLAALLEISPEETVCYPSSGSDFFLQVFNQFFSQQSNAPAKHFFLKAQGEFPSAFVLLSSDLLVGSVLSVYSDEAPLNDSLNIPAEFDVAFAFPRHRHDPAIARYIAPDTQTLPEQSLQKARDVVFKQILIITDSLKKGGRAAVILPEAALPTSMLGVIDVVIRLPRRLFPQQAANCLVVLKACEEDETVLYVDAAMSLVKASEGIVLDVKRICDVVKSRREVENFSYLAQRSDFPTEEKIQRVGRRNRRVRSRTIQQPIPVKDLLLKADPYQQTPSEREEPIALSEFVPSTVLKRIKQ